MLNVNKIYFNDAITIRVDFYNALNFEAAYFSHLFTLQYYSRLRGHLSKSLVFTAIYNTQRHKIGLSPILLFS